MAYTQNRYSPSANAYVQNASGSAIGVQWTAADGNTYLVIAGGHFNDFRPDDHYAQVVFKKYVVASSGVLALAYAYTRDISDNEFIYGNPKASTFGTFEPNPYNVTTNPDGSTTSTLKTDLVPEGQFFVDNVIFNVNNMPLSISSFLVQTILRVENIS